MEPRFNFQTDTFRPALQALFGLELYVKKSGLDRQIVNLVKTRCSQINGCAYCIDMHTKEARAVGETEQRLYGLSAWRETPYYTDRERAALEWAESLTLISQNDVPDDLYARVRQHLAEEELTALSIAVVAINSWNRLAIALRVTPGSYQAQAEAA